VWGIPKCDRPKPISPLTLSSFQSGPPVVLIDYENLVFDVGIQWTDSGTSSAVVPAIVVQSADSNGASRDSDEPLPGAVEALFEMVAEGFEVYLWLGNDVYVLAQRLKWVRAHDTPLVLIKVINLTR
jgi:hypothetical protein